VALTLLLATARSISFMRDVALKSSKKIHATAFGSLMKASVPLFFDITVSRAECGDAHAATCDLCDAQVVILCFHSAVPLQPVGRILNRFSKDLDQLDTLLPSDALRPPAECFHPSGSDRRVH
jgi:ABC-type multidrug transport system fused ATPase/permease subunit